jgi:hypothetical protein
MGLCRESSVEDNNCNEKMFWRSKKKGKLKCYEV